MTGIRGRLEARPVVTAVVYTVGGVLPLYLTSAQAVRLQQALAFDKTHFGIVVSSFFLVSAIAARLLGPVIDRNGPSAAFRGAALITLTATLFIAVVARTWWMLAIGLGIAGLANSFGQVAANLAIATVVRGGRQGLAFAAKQSAVPTGAMLAGLALPWLGAGASWRWPYLAGAVVAACLAAVSPRFEVTPAHAAATSTLTGPLLGLMAVAAVAGGIGNTMSAFVSDAAVTLGFSEPIAARLLTVGAIAAIAARLTAGLSADRRQRTGLLEITVLMSLACVGLAVLASTGGSKPAFVVGMVLTFAGAWGWQGVMYFLVIRTIDLPAATATGAVASGAFLGTVVVPPLVGAVAQGSSYATVFLGEAGFLACSIVAVQLARRAAVRATAPDRARPVRRPSRPFPTPTPEQRRLAGSTPRFAPMS